MGRLGKAFFVGTAVGLALLFFRNLIVGMPEPEKTSPPAVAPSNPLRLTPHLPPPTPGKEAKTEGVSPGFLRFVKSEAKSLDSPVVNTEKAQARVDETAALMDTKEIQYARDLALSEKGSANERILAVYLLTAAGQKSWGALQDIVFNPLKEKAEPHSEEELKAVQEKAAKYMAIDALAEKAKTDPSARDLLSHWATSVPYPEIRAYILQKLKSLPG